MSAFTSRMALTLGLALSVSAVAQAQTSRPAPISFGQTVQGRLNAGSNDSQCTPDAPNVRRYTFRGDANTRFEATMTADDFDTVLEIGQMDGCSFVSMGRNDDGSGAEDGLNSRLTGRLPSSGTYVIRATSYSADAAGPFELKLTRLPAMAAAPAPVVLQVGQAMEGELTHADPIISATTSAASTRSSRRGRDSDSDSAVDITESGRPYQMFSLTGRAGQEFLIKLDSDEFDPMLEVGVNSPLGYSVAASNDDGGGDNDGLNSRLRVTFSEAGTLIIRVSPVSAATGHFTIEVVDPAQAGSDTRSPKPNSNRRNSTGTAVTVPAPVETPPPAPAPRGH